MPIFNFKIINTYVLNVNIQQTLKLRILKHNRVV